LEKIKVLIADDHLLVRTGIIGLLKDVTEIKVVGEADCGKATVEKCKEICPHVVLMDISMPDISGIEATKLIKAYYPDINVLILTMHENEEYYFNSLKQGASGILLKNTGKDELVNAIRAVANGKRYIGSSISELMVDTLMSKFEEEITDKPKKQVVLTKREKDVLIYTAKGLPNPEIAEKLNLSVRTVETYKSNLLQKLNVKNVAGLVRYALDNGYK